MPAVLVTGSTITQSLLILSWWWSEDFGTQYVNQRVAQMLKVNLKQCVMKFLFDLTLPEIMQYALHGLFAIAQLLVFNWSTVDSLILSQFCATSIYHVTAFHYVRDSIFNNFTV